MFGCGWAGFAKPFARKKMITIQRIPLTWSVMFGCGWAGFANLLPGKNDHDRGYSTHFFCLFGCGWADFPNLLPGKNDHD
jgi:hypothetical protein